MMLKIEELDAAHGPLDLDMLALVLQGRGIKVTHVSSIVGIIHLDALYNNATSYFRAVIPEAQWAQINFLSLPPGNRERLYVQVNLALALLDLWKGVVSITTALGPLTMLTFHHTVADYVGMSLADDQLIGEFIAQELFSLIKALAQPSGVQELSYFPADVDLGVIVTVEWFDDDRQYVYLYLPDNEEFILRKHELLSDLRCVETAYQRLP